MVSGSSAACQGSLISSERENSRLLLGAVNRRHGGKIPERLITAAPECPSARDAATLAALRHSGGSTRNFPPLGAAVKTQRTYLVNGSINLHWNDKIRLADRLLRQQRKVFIKMCVSGH